MIREAIDRILELSSPEIITVGERQYSKDKLHLIVHDPRPEQLTVNTLTGFCGYLNSDIDQITDEKNLMIHIVNHRQVDLISAFDGPMAERTTFIRAELDPNMKAFPFNKWMDSEEFIIAVMSLLQNSFDRTSILQVAGNLGHEEVQTRSDDGVTQSATLKTGILKKAMVEIKNPVQLQPYRTFREAEQPVSQYVFRLRGGDEKSAPQCALFEAGGETWRLVCVKSIENYLKYSGIMQKSEIPIIA